MNDELRERARDVWACEGAIRYREQALEIVTLSNELRAEHEMQLAAYLKRLADLFQPIERPPDAWRVGHNDPTWVYEELTDWEMRKEAVAEADDIFKYDHSLWKDDWAEDPDGASFEPQRADYLVIPVWIGGAAPEAQAPAEAERNHRAMEKLRESGLSVQAEFPGKGEVPWWVFWTRGTPTENPRASGMHRHPADAILE